ncbi:hypothetical protein [Paenibacillus tyrfis]|uniref:hypothetical protein n=1 Tax=Paenibacillus tyrfis TaxID=1501230 RepID=UPI00209D288A|nr:hypothetical protein [Paenibacillus tyrfis]MCP1307578.1 hypothetical protein [Paenibacillus tyrfis]
MSTTAKLSQNTAILLERARRFGITDETLLAGLAAGDTAVLQPAVGEWYSYDEFYAYADQHGEALEEAIRSGYRMKFNTPGGVQFWLQHRFGLEAGVDYEVPEHGRVNGLKLPDAKVELLRSTLAPNWVILGEAAGSGEAESVQTLRLVIRSLHEKGE